MTPGSFHHKEHLKTSNQERYSSIVAVSDRSVARYCYSLILYSVRSIVYRRTSRPLEMGMHVGTEWGHKCGQNNRVVCRKHSTHARVLNLCLRVLMLLRPSLSLIIQSPTSCICSAQNLVSCSFMFWKRSCGQREKGGRVLASGLPRQGVGRQKKTTPCGRGARRGYRVCSEDIVFEILNRKS